MSGQVGEAQFLGYCVIFGPWKRWFEKFIENAKVQLEKDQAELKAFLARKKKIKIKKFRRCRNVSKGCKRFANSNKLQSVRENQPGVEVIVEEDDMENI